MNNESTRGETLNFPLNPKKNEQNLVLHKFSNSTFITFSRMRVAIDSTGKRVSSRPFPLNNRNCPVIWAHCLTALNHQNVYGTYVHNIFLKSLNHFIPHANKYVSCRPICSFFYFFLLYFLRGRCFNVSRLPNRIIAVPDRAPSLPHGCVVRAMNSGQAPKSSGWIPKKPIWFTGLKCYYTHFFCCYCCCCGCRHLPELDNVDGQVKIAPIGRIEEHGVRTNGSVSFIISNWSGASRIGKTLWRIIQVFIKGRVRGVWKSIGTEEMLERTYRFSAISTKKIAMQRSLRVESNAN